MSAPINRRQFIEKAGCLAGGLATCAALTGFACDRTDTIIKRPIPGAAEQLPVIGLGTWQTFDAGGDRERQAQLKQVLDIFTGRGGTVIDSSPMYGSSEAVAGALSEEMGVNRRLFIATKVWTTGREAGIRQINASFEKLRRNRLDLLQVHNLQDYATHLSTLKELKAAGKVRYTGITHYLASALPEMMRIIRKKEVDFVQCSYNLADRAAEHALLPLARDMGVAVIINQPFDSGSLFSRTAGKQLPSWAAEWGIKSRAQLFLKFIVSHPAVTCAIPGTGKPEHMTDNIQAGFGKLPDEDIRKKMVAWLES